MYRDIFQVDRHSSNLSKITDMDFKMFKNLELFMTVRHICSLQHQATSRGRWALMRILMESVTHLGKKLFLPGLLELDMQNLQRSD